MAFFCEGLCCQHSFRDFNRVFQRGVPKGIAALVSPANLQSRQSGKVYGIDMKEFDQAAVSHFERDWLGIGGTPWFSAAAGDLVYKAFVNAIQTAGPRQIKAVWLESGTVKVQTIEDERLILLLVGSPRPAGDGKAHSGGVCGECAAA